MKRLTQTFYGMEGAVSGITREVCAKFKVRAGE